MAPSSRLLAVALALVAVGARTAAAQCTPGQATLALTAADAASSAYATCFARVDVAVASNCAVTVTPADAASSWTYSALWTPVDVQDANLQGCPTDALPGGTMPSLTAENLAGAIKAALGEALFPGFDAVQSVTVGSDSVSIVTRITADNTLTYSAVAGSLGSVLAAGVGACSSKACAYNNGCPAGRYAESVGATDKLCALCLPGSSCAGSNAAPEACDAGSAATAGSATCSACPAGTFSGVTGRSNCLACPAGSYQDETGQQECKDCPYNSYAPIAGSKACMACYFGKPVVVAGAGGLDPDNMPTEGTSTGYMVATTSAASPLSNKAQCGFAPFTTACSTMNSRVVAFETDGSCAVTLMVLGDSNCSGSDDITTFTGHWVDANTILAALPDAASTAVSLKAVRSGSSLALTFFQLTTAFDKTDLGSCSDNSVAVATSCVDGTAPETNPQAVSGDVFAETTCQPCASGVACPSGVSQSCAAGTFNQIVGAATCSACPAGQSSDAGADSCAECPVGTIPNADRSDCVLCGAGSYNDATGATSCTQCEAGTYREADAPGDSCVPCAAGSYSAAGAAKCTSCAPGTATSEGGTPQDAATESCPACPAGRFAKDAGSQFCSPCPAGFFGNTTGMSGCYSCGAGAITMGAAATTCTPCALGLWKAANATDNKCKSCPRGYETRVSGTGASSCTPCAKGFYNGAANSAFCTAAPAGTFVGAAQATTFKACDPGYVTGLTPTENGGTGQFATAASRCEACPIRTYRPPGSANRCLSCPAGRAVWVASAATKCDPCPSGSTLVNATDLRCTTCPTGTFMPAIGRNGTCLSCATGFFTSDLGNTKCDPCDPGTFANVTGSSQCAACPQGTFNPNPAGNSRASCRDAPRGSYVPSAASDEALPCAAGTFQDVVGQRTCKPCPAGSYCPAGAAAPIQCKAGYVAGPRANSCVACTSGTYQPKAGQSSCVPCPAGAYCPGAAQAATTLCPAGTARAQAGGASIKDCNTCPANSFSAAAGSLKCSACIAGQWTNKRTGQTKCWPTSQSLPTARK